LACRFCVLPALILALTLQAPLASAHGDQGVFEAFVEDAVGDVIVYGRLLGPPGVAEAVDIVEVRVRLSPEGGYVEAAYTGPGPLEAAAESHESQGLYSEGVQEVVVAVGMLSVLTVRAGYTPGVGVWAEAWIMEAGEREYVRGVEPYTGDGVVGVGLPASEDVARLSGEALGHAVIIVARSSVYVEAGEEAYMEARDTARGEVYPQEAPAEEPVDGEPGAGEGEAPGHPEQPARRPQAPGEAPLAPGDDRGGGLGPLAALLLAAAVTAVLILIALIAPIAARRGIL
jgi:hypothetical protein